MQLGVAGKDLCAGDIFWLHNTRCMPEPGLVQRPPTDYQGLSAPLAVIHQASRRITLISNTLWHCHDGGGG